MNLRNNQKGFTIVELLIVIVVIAILAAISIVAYTGIQNRAKASSGKQLAAQIAKKAEIYNTARSSGSGYPTHTELTATTSAVGEAQLDSPSAVISTAVTSGTSNNGTTVSYTNQSTTGACVGYWDFSLPTPAIAYIKVGSGASGVC